MLARAASRLLRAGRMRWQLLSPSNLIDRAARAEAGAPAVLESRHRGVLPRAELEPRECRLRC